MKKQIIIPIAFMMSAIVLSFPASAQKVIQTRVTGSFEISQEFVNAHHFFSFGENAENFVFDDMDTVEWRSAPLFRREILARCKDNVLIAPHKVLIMQFSQPANTPLFRAGDLVTLIPDKYPSGFKAIASQVTPEEIIARIITLTRKQPNGEPGILPISTSSYKGTFIGFCNNYVVILFWNKSADGFYRWHIQCDYANSVVPQNEFVLK